MIDYKKSEAREWAWENMHGVANVVIPSFTQDLAHLSEKGIRHDIRLEIEYGFAGALIVCEVAQTLEEYRQCFEWAHDEAGGKLCLIHHAAFDTLDANIEAVAATQTAGAELILLSYPPNFYAETEQQIYDYTKSFCDNTDLGVILFPVPHWGFERVHPAGFSPELLTRLVDDIPNIVAIKAEGGMPTIGGFVQAHKMFGDKVIITNPLEHDAIPLASLLPMQFSGTSNTEYCGPVIPRMFQLIHEDKFDEAMELYWQIHPARMANMQANAFMSGSNFIHRMMWKYQAWLNGFNGGPLRQPTNRLVDRNMKPIRASLEASGLPVTKDHDREFFIGRNPE